MLFLYLLQQRNDAYLLLSENADTGYKSILND